MIDAYALFGLLTICFALASSLLRWYQTRFIGAVCLYGVWSVLFTNAGFLTIYLSGAGGEYARTAVMNVSLGLFCVISGAWIGLALVNGYRGSTNRDPQDIKLGYSLSAYRNVSIMLFIIMTLYFVMLGSIPLIQGIQTLLTQGFISGLANSFRISLNIYINPDARYIPLQGLLDMLRTIGMPTVLVFGIHLYRAGYIKTWQILLWGGLSIFFLIATAQRWPLMHTLVIVLIYFSLTTQNSFFSKILGKLLIISIASGITLSILLGRTSQQLHSLGELISFGALDLSQRILVGNVLVPFESYALYPNQQGFLLGQSYYQNLMSYLPGAAPSFPVTFYQTVTGDAIGFTGPPDLYTEAYINFGFWGTIVICFLWGILLSVIDNSLPYASRRLISLSFISVLIFYSANAVSTGVMYCLGLFVVYPIIFTFLFSACKIPRIYSNSPKNRKYRSGEVAG